MNGPVGQDVLHTAGGPPGGYGAPPGGGGYGPPPGGAPPGGGGYGPPPGAPPGGGGYGPPPGGGGFGGPPGPTQASAPGAPPAAPKAAKSKTGLIAGIIAAVVLIGGGAGAYFWFMSAGSKLAKYAPKDTETYVEIPSTTKALINAIGMDVFNEKELDADKSKGDIIEAFSSSFDLKKDEAEDLLTGVEAAAVASRRIERKDDDFGPSKEGVTLIKMSKAKVVEPLLASKRFEKVGALAGGVQYTISRKEVDSDKSEKLSVFESAFNEMGDIKKKKSKGDDDEEDEDDSKKKKKQKNGKVLVWFEDEALFAAGEESVVEDVGKIIKDGKESLKDNDAFKKAKWESGSSVLFFMNPEYADKSDKKDLFNEVGPILGSVKFHDGGLVMNGHVELKGKKVPKSDDLMAEETSYKLYEKLPADTIAYLAFSAKFKGDGKAVQKALIKAAESDSDSTGKSLEEALDELDKNVGFKLDTLIDAVGDEGVLAIASDNKVDVSALMKSSGRQGKVEAAKEAAEHMGFIAIFDVEDKDKAEKLVKGLKDTIEEKGKEAVEVKKKDGGFTVEAGEQLQDFFSGQLSVTVEDEKHILVVIGSKKRVESAKSVFKGDGDSLKSDKGHKNALSAVGDKGQAFLYVDAGRIAKKLLEDADDMKKSFKKKGFSLDAIVLEGDSRMVVAANARLKFKDELLTIDVSTLNAPVLGVASFIGLLTAAPEPRRGDGDSEELPKRVDPPGGGSSSGGPAPTGIGDCDTYISRMYKCADKMGSGADQIRKTMMETAETFKSSAANPASRAALAESCKKMLESMPPMCN